MSEQDRFSAMVRDVVAPALRAAGFRGSGQRFELPDTRAWIVVGIQKSRWNDPSHVRFTVNLLVAGREEWSGGRLAHDWLPEEPGANTRYPIGSFVRIGRLLPAGEDHWWEVRAGVDPIALGAEVTDAIRGPGLDWIRAQRDALPSPGSDAGQTS